MRIVDDMAALARYVVEVATAARQTDGKRLRIVATSLVLRPAILPLCIGFE